MVPCAAAPAVIFAQLLMNWHNAVFIFLRKAFWACGQTNGHTLEKTFFIIVQYSRAVKDANPMSRTLFFLCGAAGERQAMKEKAVALYLRLSREDEKDIAAGQGKDESNSIRNQRKLVLDFLKKRKELSECHTIQYIDDGYTGTDFERPGFRQMMEDIKKGKVQCVLVKDFSRFGRDYITLGDYIEYIFPFLQVRFIAVNDGYDSAEYQGKTPDIDVPFRNLAYSLYSQDISDKVRSALAVRQKKGFYVGSMPPYGYQRDENGYLIPDEETEAVVRRIYQDYLSGIGFTELAGNLNEEKIPSPKQYKINKGLLNGQETETYFWTPGTIRQILQNTAYIGVLSSGAYQNGPLGTRTHLFVPEEERIRVEDAHMPIIEKRMFREAQERMGTRKPGENNCFLLKGMVRCGECRRAMAKGKRLFRCRYQNFTVHGRMESIPEKKLEEVVWEAVRVQLWLLDREGKEEIFQRERELYEAKRKRLLKEIRWKTLQAGKKRTLLAQFYQQYRRGEIEKAEYLDRKERESAKARELEAGLDRMKSEKEELLQRIEELEDGNCSMAERLGSCGEGRKRELLHYLIESVYVYFGKRVEIEWKIKKCKVPDNLKNFTPLDM